MSEFEREHEDEVEADDLGDEVDLEAVVELDETEAPARIANIVAADSGWRAVYGGESEWEERELSRVVAWALVDEPDGERSVVGLVVDPLDPTRIVPAAEGGAFTRYGYSG